MELRQTLPRLWLMTDERLGDALLASVRRLPEGAGIIFRHYRTAEGERRRLFEAVRAEAWGRLLLLAGPAEQAAAWGAQGSHGRGPGAGLRTAPVHDLGELRTAEAAGAALLFVSPVFPTRSHPGAPTLGPEGFGAIAAGTRLPAVALGGMDAARWPAVRERGAWGWAAIDAWGAEPEAGGRH